DFIESPRQCAFVRHRILWGNLIRLIHYEMESGLVGRIEPFKERREKAPLLITRHLRHVDDGLHIALTKRLREVLSTIGRDLDIGILSAENKNRKSAGHRTIPARAQSVPNPGWVYDDDAAPSRKKVFNRALCREGLTSTSRTHDGAGPVEESGDIQCFPFHCSCPLGSAYFLPNMTCLS